MAHRIWPGTRALAQMHLDQGQRVWLVTAAPIEIAQIIARRLGLTGAMGTVAEHIDGVYTGRLVGDLLHGPAKGEAIKALAAREELDLAACSAYSDSFNDLPMLTMVGDPCAINPDARLRAYAREQGWRIRDYRTGRKAARAGLLVGAVAGAVSGTVAAGVALRAAAVTDPIWPRSRSSCATVAWTTLWCTSCSPDAVRRRNMTKAREEPTGRVIPMSWAGADAVRGLDALRTAVARILLADRIALAAGPYRCGEALADGASAPQWPLVGRSRRVRRCRSGGVV